MRIRAAFLGSPAFAVPSLRALGLAHDIALVLTQPDRRLGRGLHLVPTAVRVAATELGIPVRTYEPAQRTAIESELARLRLDLLVVVAFGHILRQTTWETARLGAINVHASLLPRWRGAAPIEHALLAGDAVSGVSLMVIERGLDSGPVLAQQSIQILPTDTRQTLTTTLAEAGAALLLQQLEPFACGRLQPVPQDLAGVTLAPELRKDAGCIDWHRDALHIERQVRALLGWPGATTSLSGTRLKLHAVRIVDSLAVAAPGTVVQADVRHGVHVACGRGTLELMSVQLAGKDSAQATTLVQGRRLHLGTRLGTPGDAPGEERT